MYQTYRQLTDKHTHTFIFCDNSFLTITICLYVSLPCHFNLLSSLTIFYLACYQCTELFVYRYGYVPLPAVNSGVVTSLELVSSQDLENVCDKISRYRDVMVYG
ncbi:hypothetical protein LSH36_25g10063 [Paralvinella palmiformis]|uniref:Uncharacterized protein n=1 Tax=Paralvinella palmiformis TaxID=53620 RepID=A0AAD9NHV2_9ANNE|nr:hypothetical protein LSH36_25g10063 [Paralvinella palmiformis]